MTIRLTIAVLALCASIAAGLAAGPVDGRAAPANARGESPAAAHFATAPSRAVSVRIRQTRVKTHRRVGARQVGRKLATLRPSWVTGSLRFARHQYPKRAEARAFNTVRTLVRRKSPGAQFDVVLNAMQYETKTAIRQTMARLRSRLQPDGWFFDFFSTAYRKRPGIVRKAIASAHANGEWIGGNVFGISKRRPMPARADFLSVQDTGLKLDLRAVRRLARKHEVLYHLNSDPRDPRSGGCRFIRELSTKGRRSHVRRRAAQGERKGFHVAYPVLFPQCLRPRPGPSDRNILFSYNAFQDPPMAREIRKLLDRYEPLPLG